jgi:hypothetical protein
VRVKLDFACEDKLCADACYHMKIVCALIDEVKK